MQSEKRKITAQNFPPEEKSKIGKFFYFWAVVLHFAFLVLRFSDKLRYIRTSSARP